MDDQLQVLYWLIMRNMIVLRKKLFSLLFDSSLLLASHLFLFINIFPLFGVPFEFVPPLFFGEMFLLVLFLQGSSYSFEIATDLEGPRTIDYYQILPISKRLLILSYGINYMVEAVIMTFPLVVCGIYVLSFFSTSIKFTWIGFLGYYFFVMAFCSLLFLSFAFQYSLSWLMANLWARRLVPMFCIGAANVPWIYISEKIPVLSYVALLNPATYIAEGLRATMLEGTFLPLYLCFGALLVISIASYVVLLSGMQSKLDVI